MIEQRVADMRQQAAAMRARGIYYELPDYAAA